VIITDEDVKTTRHLEIDELRGDINALHGPGA